MNKAYRIAKSITHLAASRRQILELNLFPSILYPNVK